MMNYLAKTNVLPTTGIAIILLSPTNMMKFSPVKMGRAGTARLVWVVAT